ncbi:MAG TPA: GNAT family N-acetyltransferase [Acidobacteriaceae bacterium]
MGTSSQAVADEEAVSEAPRCVIRVATPADIPWITAIYVQFVSASTATSELTPPSEAEMLRRFRAVRCYGLPYLVAELEGYIVGFCYAKQFRPREGYRNTVEDSIYVRPDCIGHGVGRLLLTELIAQCRKSACHSMVACIVGENPSSVALHTSLGFQRAGLLPEAVYKFDKWLPMLMMQLIL